ncbi:MAG: Rha family transcriptional regulator [Eubacteriaceae bacterium]
MDLKFRDLENEIVFVKKDNVFTDSKTIADTFERRHDHVLKLIDECIDSLKVTDYEHKPTFRVMQNKINIGNGARRTSRYYTLDRDAFMFLMMKMKGKKADEFKLMFIHAFNEMEQWIKDRAVGRGVRLSMTDSIKDYLPESPNKKFKYKHFTDLVYKKVLGKTKKQIETELGRKVDNLREICTDEQLNQFINYENEISVLLKYNKDYNEIKEILK